MNCIGCGATAVTERRELTAQGYRRFRCRTCGKQFNERSTGVLNRTHYPSDVIALVVLWRLRYKLSLRDLPEMFLIRGIVFSHEAVRDWETKLAPALAANLRHRRRGKAGRSWYVDETYIKGTIRMSGVLAPTGQLQRPVWLASALAPPSQFNAECPRQREHPRHPDGFRQAYPRG